MHWIDAFGGYGAVSEPWQWVYCLSIFISGLVLLGGATTSIARSPRDISQLPKLWVVGAAFGVLLLLFSFHFTFPLQLGLLMLAGDMGASMLVRLMMFILVVFAHSTAAWMLFCPSFQYQP